MRFARHLNKILQKLVKKIGEIFFLKIILLKKFKTQKTQGFCTKICQKGCQKTALFKKSKKMQKNCTFENHKNWKKLQNFWIL